jgi:hypothetical protein
MVVSNKKLDNAKLQKEKVDAYSRFFLTPDGQKVYKDLESFCGYNSTSVCETVPNELQTFFCEGKRRVFLRIKSFIEKGKE